MSLSHLHSPPVVVKSSKARVVLGVFGAQASEAAPDVKKPRAKPEEKAVAAARHKRRIRQLMLSREILRELWSSKEPYEGRIRAVITPSIAARIREALNLEQS